MNNLYSIPASILFFTIFYLCSSGCTVRPATDNVIGATTSITKPEFKYFDFDSVALGDSMDDVLEKWDFTEADIQEDKQYTNADWLKRLSGTLPTDEYQALKSEWNELVPRVYALAKGSGVDRRPVQKNNISYLAYFDSEKQLQRYVVIVNYPENTDIREALRNSPGLPKGHSENGDPVDNIQKQLERKGTFQTKQQTSNGNIAINASQTGNRLIVKYSALGYIRDVETRMKKTASGIQSRLMKKYGLGEKR